MKKAPLIFIPLILILAVATQWDEELSEEAQALLQLVEEPKESDAYLYLLGISASPDAEPMEIGKQRLKEYEKWYKDGNYEMAKQQEADKLPIPDGELFCAFSGDDCIKTLFTKEYDIEAMEREYRILIDRVRRFHGFGEYHTLALPSLQQPIPPYAYITKAERLAMLKAISVYKNGKPEDAVELLRKQAGLLMTGMALQDDHLGKMVYVSVVSDVVDAASVIIKDKADPYKPKRIMIIPTMDMRYDLVVAREFGGLYKFYTGMDGYSRARHLGDVYNAWIGRMAFKPNKTINVVAPHYVKLTEYAAMSPKGLAEELDKEKEVILKSSAISNPLGRILSEAAWPRNEEMLVIKNDLKAKIELFNQIYHYGVPEDKVENPYYDNEYSYREGDSICFRGPVEDERGIRCLRTGI